MIHFRCGRCAEWVRAGDLEAGRAVTCARCGHVNICPEASARLRGPESGPRTESASGVVASGSGVVWTAVAVFVLVGAGWGAWSAFGASRASEVVPSAANPAEARQQEILQKDLGKPGDPVLDRMYQELNAAHFAGALPVMPVLWEPRLAEVGQLSAQKFTLEGMFGHVGRRTAILLNPDLQSDKRALARALCHEMVHAHLFATGDRSTNHGPAFQAVLRRLSDEGAFEGILASEDEREKLRAWLDEESARLDAERAEMDRVAGDIERDRSEVEQTLADLNARVTAANAEGRGWPARAEIESIQSHRDAYNQRAADANTRAARAQADISEFNRQVARYNLMLSYPDGLDEESLVKPKPTTPRAGGQ